MSYVEVDDFECPTCEEETVAELNTKTGNYICYSCGGIFGGKQE